LDDGQTQRLHGKMPKEEFRQLNKLLEAAEFRSLSGDHGGLIRQESERFVAEIPFGDRWREDGARKWLEHEAWRLQWLNADGESPFPASVSTLVDWLKRFQPKDGKSFESRRVSGWRTTFAAARCSSEFAPLIYLKSDE
jgi:hypothetical protein